MIALWAMRKQFVATASARATKDIKTVVSHEFFFILEESVVFKLRGAHRTVAFGIEASHGVAEEVFLRICDVGGAQTFEASKLVIAFVEQLDQWFCFQTNCTIAQLCWS